MARVQPLVLLLVLSLAIAGCGKSPQETALSELSKRGFSFTEKDFIRCAREGNEEAVSLFLIAGMDPNVKDKGGMTPLMVAAEKGHAAVVNTLILNGADIHIKAYDSAALDCAAATGQTDCVEVLLDAGADINRANERGFTPLMHAVMTTDNIDTVRLLIERGADLNAKAAGDMSALYPAERRGNVEIVKALLEAGAEVNAEISGGITPLSAAAHSGHTAVVGLLLENGADPNAVSSDGWTPMKRAKEGGHIEIVNLLKEAGAEK